MKDCSLLDLLRLKKLARDSHSHESIQNHIQARIKEQTEKVINEGRLHHERFGVICDETNNTREDYENNVVHISILEPAREPDFVITINV